MYIFRINSTAQQFCMLLCFLPCCLPTLFCMYLQVKRGAIRVYFRVYSVVFHKIAGTVLVCMDRRVRALLANDIVWR